MALADQAEWSERATTLCAKTSTGPTTALAVTLIAELDRELRNKSDGSASLDDVLPVIVGTEVDLETLTEAVRTIIGETPDTLHIDKLPGCRSIQ